MGLGFRVQGLGFRVQGFGLRGVSGLHPKGPSAQVVGFQGSKTTQSMDYLGTRTLWVRV